MSALRWLMFVLALPVFGLTFAAPACAIQQTALSAIVEGDPVSIFLYRPEGHGPFPLAVLSHGSPRLPANRATYGPNTLRAQALAFAERGIAAAVVLRRGYGGTGHWAEAYGPCNRPDYFTAGLASAKDIEAALATLASQPDLDSTRVALVGVSAGGWASLAAGSQFPVRAVVNFAGGRGSSGPDSVCGEETLISAVGRYGETSRSPELWIYSVNDHFFGPALAARLHNAFTASHGRAKFIAAPAYREDGHAYFNDVPGWMPQVQDFLLEVGFLTGGGSQAGTGTARKPDVPLLDAARQRLLNP